jgi:hypothetical protein
MLIIEPASHVDQSWRHGSCSNSSVVPASRQSGDQPCTGSRTGAGSSGPDPYHESSGTGWCKAETAANTCAGVSSRKSKVKTTSLNDPMVSSQSVGGTPLATVRLQLDVAAHARVGGFRLSD